MSEFLTTLPGDIPGLLRQWSPLLIRALTSTRRAKGTLRDTRPMSDGRLKVYSNEILCATNAALPDDILLDLSEETARAHAAWWARAQITSRGGWKDLTTADLDRLMWACDGHPMTPEQIDTLARLVLRLAGRAP